MKKFLLFLSILAIGAVTFTGCKKKDSDSGTDLNKPYKVRFVATVSAGSSINHASVVWGVSNESFTTLSGTSWTKEYNLTEKDLRSFTNNPTKNISFGVGAQGKDANATGKVEIFVNDALVKTGSGTGTALSPQATYIFD